MVTAGAERICLMFNNSAVTELLAIFALFIIGVMRSGRTSIRIAHLGFQIVAYACANDKSCLPAGHA